MSQDIEDFWSGVPVVENFWNKLKTLERGESSDLALVVGKLKGVSICDETIGLKGIPLIHPKFVNELDKLNWNKEWSKKARESNIRYVVSEIDSNTKDPYFHFYLDKFGNSFFPLGQMIGIMQEYLDSTEKYNRYTEKTRKDSSDLISAITSELII